MGPTGGGLPPSRRSLVHTRKPSRSMQQPGRGLTSSTPLQQNQNNDLQQLLELVRLGNLQNGANRSAFSSLGSAQQAPTLPEFSLFNNLQNSGLFHNQQVLICAYTAPFCFGNLEASRMFPRSVEDYSTGSLLELSSPGGLPVHKSIKLLDAPLRQGQCIPLSFEEESCWRTLAIRVEAQQGLSRI